MTTEIQTIPPDDLQRNLALARPNEDQNLRHIGLAGDTYTILLTGEDTAGRYCLIDMHIPPGGGPPPHRHDFEEMFTVLEGEVEVTFRGAKTALRASETANIRPTPRTNSTTYPSDGRKRFTFKIPERYVKPYTTDYFPNRLMTVSCALHLPSHPIREEDRIVNFNAYRMRLDSVPTE